MTFKLYEQKLSFLSTRFNNTCLANGTCSIIHMEPAATQSLHILPAASSSEQQRMLAAHKSQLTESHLQLKSFNFNHFTFLGLIHLFFDIEGKTGVVFFSWLTPCSLFLFNPFTSLPRDVDSFNYWRSSLNPIGKENLRMNGANKIVHFVYDGLDENMRGQSFFLSLFFFLTLQEERNKTISCLMLSYFFHKLKHNEW